MKNKILFITLLAIGFASCIPSLHPIYTENNRTVDDRIVGDWASEVTMKENKKLDIKIESTQDLEIDEIGLFDNLFSNGEKTTYKFERAATLTYTKVSDNSNSKVKLTHQRQSQPRQKLIDQGFEISEVDIMPYYILTYNESGENETKEETLLVNLTKIGENLYMDFKPLEELESPNPFGVNWVPAHTFAKVSFQGNMLNLQSFDADYIEKLIKDKRVRLKHEVIDDNIVLTASTTDLRSFILKYGNDEDLFIEGDFLQSI